MAGMDIRVASPAGFNLDDADADRVAALGGTLVRTEDPVEAVAGVDAVYTDVWVSMGEDAERRRRLRHLAPYGVTRQLMAKARSDAIFMHCLPAHRGEEVTEAVIDGPQSLVWQQAANRMPTEQAALLAHVGRIWDSEG